MGLAERLAARASAREATAQVDCGELGSVTVEALPVRELELLLREPDGQRAVFYAACRELQTAGEDLRREGKIFTPYGIMQFVSDSEARAGAEAVLSLSGWSVGEPGEVRLLSAQENSGTVRPGSVRMEGAENPASSEVRLSSVQMAGGPSEGDGQVSHETGAETAAARKDSRRTQTVGGFAYNSAQNVVSYGEQGLVSAGAAPDTVGGVHETESEFGGAKPRQSRETTSESGMRLHESASESPEMLHDMESELAERTARQLLVGLQRAKWVRGG